MPLTIESATRKDQTSGNGATLEHRHFAFIAATIKELSPKYREAVALHFADACRYSNPRFDRARFMRACGF